MPRPMLYVNPWAVRTNPRGEKLSGDNSKAGKVTRSEESDQRPDQKQCHGISGSAVNGDQHSRNQDVSDVDLLAVESIRQRTESQVAGETARMHDEQKHVELEAAQPRTTLLDRQRQ